MVMSDGDDQGRAHRERIARWFDSPLGRALVAAEHDALRECAPQTYSPVVAQIGALSGLDAVTLLPGAVRVVVDEPMSGLRQAGPRVIGLPTALPFGANSIDVAVLAHALEFCSEPHRLLREVAAAVVPHGHVIIVSFNPVSLWGLRRLVSRWRGSPPWTGSFLRLARMQDWLALLEFDVVAGRALFYRPPVGRERLRDMLSFMEQAGDRWWPALGAVYILVARKRELGVRLLPRARRVRSSLAPRLAHASGKVVARSRARLTLVPPRPVARGR